MCTLILAFINAKYQHDYGLLFLGTILLDIAILDTISLLLL
ncbi:hypothetical protein S140_203 [Shewanella sp. phage 1/40]|nr:hypothetical protein S140_203 [Shewanella sp. phage 1/40]AHK11610.1 hypothetical protein S140_203 [Shewanella sp. phage 1/40]